MELDDIVDAERTEKPEKQLLAERRNDDGSRDLIDSSQNTEDEEDVDSENGSCGKEYKLSESDIPVPRYIF